MIKLAKIVFGLTLCLLSFSEAFGQATNFGFTPVGSTQNISGSVTSSNVLLNSSPGDTVLIQNTGTVTAYVKCGTTATTSDTPIQGGWGISLSCPPANRVAAITASSTTTLTVTKGLGNFVIAGGSSSGGGGGAVTIADGADVAEGAQANAVCSTATGTCSVISLSKYANSTLASILSAVQGSTPAGTNVIGALSANQSVNLSQVGGNATAVGSGVQATALRTTLATDSPGIITLGPAAIANSVPTIPSSQYPGNATAAANPITASTTGTTGATTATLAGVASKTTFICGFTITSDATTALAGAATVTGTVTGTLNYIQNVGGATAAGILTQTFTPCIPASATNTGIAVNSVAAGTGGNTAVTAWGYQL